MNTFFKKVRWIALLGVGAALAGCNQTVKITDGIIPNELLPYVQKFLGEYSGQVERRATDLVLSLDGNRLVVKSTDDLIAPACKSKIGNLTKLTYHEEKDKTITVSEALFDLDPNLCGNDVRGRELKVVVNKEAPLTLDIDFLDHVESGWVCDNLAPYPGPYYPYPGDHCRLQSYNIYQTGRFVHH